jgi:general secretion pathway protein F
MAYPMFLILASAVTILVIFKLIIPRFFEIFDQNMETLPFVSRALFSISSFMDLTNLFLFLGVIGLIILFARLLNLRGVLRMFYSSLVYVPVFKKLIFYLELSRFSFSMHSMLKSGVEFINALKLSVEVIQNTFIRVSIERTINQIKEGKSIESAFSHISFLPPMMHVMLKVGEKSGNLKEIFFELYNVFDEKLKNLMKKALLLLEPLIITIMGIIVGIIVMSLMLTVMSVSNIKL